MRYISRTIIVLSLVFISWGLVAEDFYTKGNWIYWETSLPEYDLTKREIFRKMIEATYKLENHDRGPLSEYFEWRKKEEKFTVLSFYTIDSVDYCTVYFCGRSEGLREFYSEDLKGYGVLDGDTVFIDIYGRNKYLPIKSRKKKKFKFRQHFLHTGNDSLIEIFEKSLEVLPFDGGPFHVTYKFEGPNARLHLFLGHPLRYYRDRFKTSE